MIRINLLKKPVRKKRQRRWRVSPKAFFAAAGIVVCVLIGGGAWWFWRNVHTFLPPPKPATQVRDDYAPTMRAGAKAIEDIVEDRFDAKEKLTVRGLLDFPYEHLSFIEKVNYEIHFAKNVCDLLAKNAEPGVDFTTVQAESFTDLRGEGVARSQEKVVALFTSLKKSRDVELLPRPASKFTQSGDAFRFVISCKTEFRLNLEAPFLVDAATILDYGELPGELKKIVAMAQEQGVTVRTPPARIDASFAEGYRRVRYRFAGVSSYAAFVSFVRSLYDRHVQCAFERLKLTALDQHSLKIEADLLLTTSK